MGSSMAYCTECGALLEDGAKFCGQCGKGAVPAQPDNGSGDVEPKAEGQKVDSQSEVVSAVGNLAGKAIQAMENVVDAPDTAGEFVAGTWSAGPIPFGGGAAGEAVQAVQGALQQGGQVVRQVQQVAQAVSEVVPQEAPVAADEQPAQPLQAAQEMPAQAQPKATQLAPMTQTEQFKSHRPTGRYASSGGGSRPAAEKKKSKLPVVLVAVGAAILVAAFALYVVPLFIPHPYDPNSHVALTSDSSSSASGSSTSSTSSSEGSSGSSSSSSNGSASSSASASSSSSSASSSSSTSGGSPTATGSYSTDERPKIGEFKWMTGETDKGNAPAGAARIVDFGKLTGGWKAYMYGGNLERLLNVTIDAGQSGAQVTLDWYYIRDNKQDKAFEDTTASSTFTGTFDGGMLDAMGSGRITLTAFWEQDGHQYATGSFMWPSGETEVIALVRP